MITHHPLHHIHQHHSLIGASKVQPNCPLCYGIHHWLASCMKWIKGYRYQYTGTWGIYYIGQPTIKHCRLNKTCEFLLFPTIKTHVWLKRNKKRRLARRFDACYQREKRRWKWKPWCMPTTWQKGIQLHCYHHYHQYHQMTWYMVNKERSLSKRHIAFFLCWCDISGQRCQAVKKMLLLTI